MLKSTKFWLIVSLCFNLIFMGVLVGGAFRAKQMRYHQMAPPNEVTAIIRSMSKDGRRDMIEGFRRGGEPKSRANIDELAALIDAEPFDPSKVQAYFEANRLANDDRVTRAQNVLLENLTNATDAERDQIAENLRHMPKRHPRDRHGKGERGH